MSYDLLLKYYNYQQNKDSFTPEDRATIREAYKKELYESMRKREQFLKDLLEK